MQVEALVRIAVIIQEHIEDAIGVTMDKRGQLEQTKMLMWSGRVDEMFPQETQKKTWNELKSSGPKNMEKSHTTGIPFVLTLFRIFWRILTIIYNSAKDILVIVSCS